jgi:transposase-like protein
MTKAVFENRHFHDEHAAYEYLEERVWPNGPVCPHCGGFERIGKLKGKSTRVGVHKCYQCRKPFRVTVGTVFESSHIPLRLWLQATHLMTSSKKGISANQLHRTLGITLKSAWFMCHRIREAMKPNGDERPLGGEGKIVEADETFVGMKIGFKRSRGAVHKMKILSLVERGGSVKSVRIPLLSRSGIEKIIRENVHPDSRIMTDTAAYYRKPLLGFAGHETVNHMKDEYVRGEVYTNTLEGYFSLFKRGMRGVYQHCREKHLHRYLAEFDFRYNHRVALGINDDARTIRALKGIVGKRLTYETTNKGLDR